MREVAVATGRARGCGPARPRVPVALRWVGALALAGVLAGVACRSSTHGPTPTPAPATPTPPPAATTAPTSDATPSPSRPVSAGAYQGAPVFPQVNFSQMLGLEVIPHQPGFALVLSKDGIIRRVDLADESAAATTFLDVSDRLIRNPGAEEGLLGLAFSPDYATSGKFYVYYTTGNPRHNRVSRFISSGDHADPASEHVVIDLPEKRFSNHNGGSLIFGPDGYLYIGTGDGGGGGDPDGNGQNTSSLLGKVLRIDVSGDDYTIPADNPFASGGGRGEVYAYGLRNPWRLAFDPATQQLWAGDVGQNKWEEVDRIVKGGNYGWNIMEGDHCYKPATGCDMSGLIRPRAEYSHDFGCSITGGFVYRGSEMPELRGWYVYSDYCSGRVWAVNTADEASEPVQIADTKASVTSFAEDPSGELYLVTFDKEILKLERAG